MNIKEFTADINKRGVLKNNKYLVTIAANPYMTNKTGANPSNETRLFQIRCDSVTLPGMSFASADGPPRLGYGPVERHPYNVIFDELTLNFLVDAGSEIHKMLYDWANCIVNFDGRGAKSLTAANGPVKGINSKWGAYEVGYRDNYATDIQIDVYKDSGESGQHKLSMTVYAYNAFPMGFPSVGMDWGAGEVIKLRIPFAYTDYRVEYKGETEKVVSGAPQKPTYDEALSLEQNFDRIVG